MGSLFNNKIAGYMAVFIVLTLCFAPVKSFADQKNLKIGPERYNLLPEDSLPP